MGPASSRLSSSEAVMIRPFADPQLGQASFLVKISSRVNLSHSGHSKNLASTSRPMRHHHSITGGAPVATAGVWTAVSRGPMRPRTYKT